MSSAERLAPSSSALLNRSRPVVIEYNGRRINGFEGDTIASAMLAAGVDVFSRSFKYHRRRGLLCCEGHCPNCMMNVDGSPNVRACMEPARNGMQVTHQNAWPSPDFDLLAATEKADSIFATVFRKSLMPVGFYYKIFHKPRAIWPIAEHFIRKVAGLGKVDASKVPPYTYDKQHLRADVLVIGGGPAGLSAAIAAAETGVSVTLVDENPFLGGHFRFQNPESKEFKKAAELEKQLRAKSNVRILTEATAFGLYEGNMVGIVKGRREIRLRAKQVIVASGIIERPFVFGNNDLPGIILGRAVQRLVHLYGIRPGKRAVVVGSNDRALKVAVDLARAGVEVVAYADHRDALDESSSDVQTLRSNGTVLLSGTTAVSAKGKRHVESVVLAPIARGRESGAQFDCDLLVISTGGDPVLQIVQQGGARGFFEERRVEFLARRLGEGHFVAGDSNGIHDAAAIVLDGRRAGLTAAQGLGGSDQSAVIKQLEEEISKNAPVVLNSREMVSPVGKGKRFVCVCEDVAEKDVCDAVKEGFDGIETLKRYSTIAMGPCQGKMCQMAAVGLCARETGRTIEETGTTTSRPPYNPVLLGALTGRNYHPHKTVPTHSRHVALKAKVINLGDWLRPEVYTDPAEESHAVHEGVGLIDVSTLGRIDLRGPDVVQLLDKVYINSWSNLKTGRIRYGVMCDDSGIIFDDGTCARLGAEHYFMTTTTSGVETVYQWLLSWLVGSSSAEASASAKALADRSADKSGLDVCVTNVTGGYGGVNVAGPRARDVLKKVTSMNLDSKEFPYLGCAQGKVADVPCILFRIGFVGELGYEIHFPSEYGEFMWDVLMDAGQKFDIKPFGVETQRILRLQKKHIIVGQDTDALSNPLEADLAWAVKFDKPDFIGRRALTFSKEGGISKSLIGFEVLHGPVPEEGNQAVHNGRSIGRVTSARFSPYLNKTIGLAWLPTSRAKEGEPFWIRSKGTHVSASVVTKPFYDPEGGRMKA